MTDITLGQLMDGRHVSGDTNNNALLCAQKAVLVNPGQSQTSVIKHVSLNMKMLRQLQERTANRSNYD